MSAPPLPEIFGNYSLGDFVEVVSPAGISWLPQTAGWLWLAAFALAYGLHRGWRWLRHWYRNRYRREATAALAGLAEEGTSIAQINRLLKLTALAVLLRVALLFVPGSSHWRALLPSRADRQAMMQMLKFYLSLVRTPLPAWYALASLLAWLGEYVIPYRRKLVNGQLRKCFPELDEAAITRIRRAFYRRFAGVMVEIIKALTMKPVQFRSHVQLIGAEAVREHVSAGRGVVLMGSHCCNWEWTLQILALDLGCPLVIPYKPMRDAWADRLLLSMRSRFGATMIAARHLPIHVMRRRKEPMAIAVAADQDPGTAGARQFATFFGQETAFYQGPEAIARAASTGRLFTVPTGRHDDFHTLGRDAVLEALAWIDAAPRD